MSLGKKSFHELGGEKGTPPLRRRYSTVIGSSSVKVVADRHTGTGDELFRIVTVDDLEPSK